TYLRPFCASHDAPGAGPGAAEPRRPIYPAGEAECRTLPRLAVFGSVAGAAIRCPVFMVGLAARAAVAGYGPAVSCSGVSGGCAGASVGMLRPRPRRRCGADIGSMRSLDNDPISQA